MIVVRLMGGLGNQMFQWAYAKNLSLLKGTDLYFDLSFVNADIQGVTKRYYSLGKFPGMQEREFHPDMVNGKKFVSITDQTPLVGWDESLNYFLNGYFQNERFFSDHADEIRGILGAPSYMAERFGIKENSVSLHVRRTDYLGSNGFHPVQEIEYYERALCEIGHYERLFVFSDDIEWCRENLNFENMVFVDGNDDVVDMWLMSLCRDNIMANSSFSWWGAWLNRNPNKKVVYPKRWFGGQDADIACVGWTGI